MNSSSNGKIIKRELSKLKRRVGMASRTPSMERVIPITLTPEQGLRVSRYISSKISKEKPDGHLEFLVRLFDSLTKETIFWPNEVDYKLIIESFRQKEVKNENSSIEENKF